MLKYPKQVPSQQPVLAPLQALINQVPACELFITFASNVSVNMDSLSTGALKNAAKVARNMQKVFDYLHHSQTQSVPSSQYLLNLSRSAYDLAVNCALAAVVSTGTGNITLTSGAQDALNTLDAWDSVQGYTTPSNPGALATAVMEGVTVT